MKSLTQILIRALSISSEAWNLNVEATPYEDQAPIIEARRQCLAAYASALKAESPREAQIHLEIARELEAKWNTASEASMAIANPIFDPAPPPNKDPETDQEWEAEAERLGTTVVRCKLAHKLMTDLVLEFDEAL